MECVCYLTRKITDDSGQEDDEKKERQKIDSVEEGVRKKINYREEETFTIICAADLAAEWRLL